MSANSTTWLQQQVAVLTTALTDLVDTLPSVLLSGAGCLAASVVFLWTLVLLYRQRSSLFGSSLNRRGGRAWFLAVAAALSLFGNLLMASSLLNTYLLKEAWVYMTLFSTSVVVVMIASCCAVERFLVILTNKTAKWIILGLAVVASLGNGAQHIYLMWLPTSEALTGNKPKIYPVFPPLAVLIGTIVPCIVILITGVGIFSFSLIKHLRESKKRAQEAELEASGPVSTARTIYVVLLVHHAHLLATIGVYVIFGTALTLTLNQSHLRGPLAYFWYSFIIALESGLEDIARTVNKRSAGSSNKSQSRTVESGANNRGYASNNRAPLPQYSSPMSPAGIQVANVQMTTYGQAFALQPQTDSRHHYNQSFAQQARPDTFSVNRQQSPLLYNNSRY